MEKVTKVYLVYVGSYDEQWLEGVYATKSLAKKACAQLKKDYDDVTSYAEMEVITQ